MNRYLQLFSAFEDDGVNVYLNNRVWWADGLFMAQLHKAIDDRPADTWVYRATMELAEFIGLGYDRGSAVFLVADGDPQFLCDPYNVPHFEKCIEDYGWPTTLEKAIKRTQGLMLDQLAHAIIKQLDDIFTKGEV